MSTWPPPLSAELPAIPSAGYVSPDRRFDGRRPFQSFPLSDSYRDPYGRERHPADYERDWSEWDRRRSMTRGRSRSPEDGTFSRYAWPS